MPSKVIALEEAARLIPDGATVSVSSSSGLQCPDAMLRALGGLGLELMKDETWPQRLVGLRDIDWSKKNPDWENVCIVANSVVSNRQARAATKAYVKGMLGMPLTDAELRSISKEPVQSELGGI